MRTILNTVLFFITLTLITTVLSWVVSEPTYTGFESVLLTGAGYLIVHIIFPAEGSKYFVFSKDHIIAGLGYYFGYLTVTCGILFLVILLSGETPQGFVGLVLCLFSYAIHYKICILVKDLVCKSAGY